MGSENINIAKTNLDLIISDKTVLGSAEAVYSKSDTRGIANLINDKMKRFDDDINRFKVAIQGAINSGYMDAASNTALISLIANLDTWKAAKPAFPIAI